MDEVSLRRLRARMDKIDGMSPALRALVHEHGLTIVQAFLDHGLGKPRAIAHIIRCIRQGSYEIGDRSDQPKITRQDGAP